VILFERRQQILHLLREHLGIRVADMAQRLGVSEGTIRNDLTALEEEGLLTRVRGGAVPREEYQFLNRSFAERAQVNADAKQRIARYAAGLVESGDSILLDASTTVFAMVPFVRERRSLTVVTNGIEVGLALAQDPSYTVILVGGTIRADGTSVVGDLGEKLLKDLHIKTAFVSCSGFSVDAGLTEVDLQEVQIKKRMIRSAERVVALVDSTKLGRVDLTSFASLEQVSLIITDGGVEPRFIQQLRQTCTDITVCGEETASSFNPCDEPSRNAR
jgi:DeoR/GlpR family transcriptional regulator of sugar metabolism